MRWLAALVIGVLIGLYPAYAANLTNGVVTFLPFDASLSSSTGYNDAVNTTYPVGYGSGLQGQAVLCNTSWTPAVLKIPDNDSLDVTTDWTIAFAYKVNSFTGPADSQVTTKGTNSWSSTVGADGVFTPSIGKNGVDQLNSGTSFNVTSTWYHYTATRTGGTTRLYINGNQVASSGALADFSATASDVILCRQDASYYFDGYIDNFGVWNRSLNSSEVSQLYYSSGNPYVQYVQFDGGEIGTPSGNGWYSDEGSGTTISYGNTTVLSGLNSIEIAGSGVQEWSWNISGHNKTVNMWFYDDGVSSYIYTGYGDVGSTQSLAIARNTGVSASYYILAVPSTQVTTIPLSTGWHKATYYVHPNGSVIMELDDQVVFEGYDSPYNVSTAPARVGFYHISSETIYADNVTVYDGMYDVAFTQPTQQTTYTYATRSRNPFNNTYGNLYAPVDANESGARTYFFLNVSASADVLQNYTFMFDNGTGTFVNETYAISGTNQLLEIEKYVNATNGSTIRYQWFVSSNQSQNQTPEYSYVATDAPEGTLAWEAYANNPLKLGALPSNASSAGGEWYGFIEGDTLYFWTHRQGPDTPNDHHIYYGYTTDPYNLSQNPHVGVNFPGVSEPTFGDVVKTTSGATTVGGQYHLLPTERDTNVLYHYVSSTKNNTNWTDYCGGPTNVSGNWNPSIVYDDAGVYDTSNGRWHMMIETPAPAMDYYSSFDGCNWTYRGQAFAGGYPGGGGHNWFFIDANGQWVVYRAKRDTVTQDTTYWYKGNSPFNLTLQGVAMNTSQDSQWQPFGGQSYITVPEVIIVPNASQQYFERLVYYYFAGNENDTFVAYDLPNRTFYEAHDVQQYFASFVPVNYTLEVQMNSTNNNTFVNDFCVSKDGGGYNCTTNGSVYFYELSNGTVNLSWTTAGTHVNDSANVTVSGNTTYIIQATAIEILQFTGPVSPSGVVLTSARNVNISWGSASGNSSVVTYNVTFYNGTNTSVASTTATSVLYNLSAQDVVDAQVFVTAYDDDESITVAGSLFNVTLPVYVAAVCPATTYPNEDNLPTVASIPVNVTTTSELAVTNVKFRLYAGAVDQVVNCSLSTSAGDQKNYTCAVPMQYYYAAGSYSGAVNATTAIKVGQNTTSCGYGALLASKRSANAVSFPNAAPGVVNAVSSPVIVVRNTGNVPFNITTTGYDLAGRSVPAMTLAATNFQAGETLPSAVALQHAVQKVLKTGVNGSINTSVYYWLSMPSNQLVQEYYSATAWDLTVSG